MNPEELEKIKDTLPGYIINKIKNLYQIELEKYPYDLRKIKNKLIKDVEDEEKDLTLQSLKEKEPQELITLEQFAFESQWMQKLISNEDIFATTEYFPTVKSKQKFPIIVGVEGYLYENIALLKVGSEIYGFIRYFASDLMPETGINEVFEKYDTLTEVVKHYELLEEKKDPFFLDTKSIAKQALYQEESNFELDLITFEESNYWVLKNICLSKEMVNDLRIVNE